VSRKHFEAFARMIVELRNRIGEHERRLVARQLACTLSEYNTRFDHDRFLKACFPELSEEQP
jgi:hypothetical protein